MQHFGGKREYWELIDSLYSSGIGVREYREFPELAQARNSSTNFANKQQYY